MSSRRFAGVRRVFGGLWWALDAARRLVFNLLFLALLVVLMVAWLRGPAPLADQTTLVLELEGAIAEQKPGVQRPSVLNPVAGFSPQKVQLRDIRTVLSAAASDPKIDRLLLLLDDLDGAGMATLHEVATGIDRFRATGKPVVAWGSGFDQRQYYLAARADQVLMHPFGTVSIEGLGSRRNYYRDALDRLGITIHLVKAGEFKSAAEPLVANRPSPAALEADLALYGALWASYTTDVEAARKLPAGAIGRMIDALPARLKAAGGDQARLALDEKLVDALKTRDELRQMLMQAGASEAGGKSFRQVGFSDYLALQRPRTDGAAVGVVVAEGEIIDGPAPAGTVGGRSTAALVRRAREDDRVKAVVLRVNSPGGSVFGSELIRRELELTRAAGKPVVVSMGDVAASGGYWVSMSSDEVIADRGTVTGSIGVFGLLPTAEQALDKLGIHVEGVETTWLRGAGDPRTALDPRYAEVVQASVDHIYADFIARVARARKTTPEKVDAVAQGRVWTGAQALERGLVDRLGGFGDALDSAARRGGLPAGYPVVYLERDPGRLALALSLLESRVAAWVGLPLGGVLPALPAGIAGEVVRDLGWLAEATAGGRAARPVAHCLCAVP